MKRRRQQGMSLIEVLVAIVLFAIAASGTAALATESIRRTVENRHGTAAALLAQQELERVRELDYPNIAANNYTATMAGQSFTVDTAVQTDVPVANVKSITVTVSWTGPEGSRSYAVPTIYTDVTAS